jgi:FAD:protein FMN transferase
MPPLTLARNAMNTRFELVLHGGNAASLQAAGEAALAEVERIENQISLFRPGSELARVNALAAREPVRVSPEVFALLAHAQRLNVETQGAFDITIAPLLRCWGLLGQSEGRVPTAEELAVARAITGMALVELRRLDFTVRFTRDGVMLDLGAIGKGYAVEMAAEILREAGVSSALIHGGTSTVCAIGTPPDADAWKVAVDAPRVNQPLTRPANEAFGVPALAAGPANVTGHPRDRLRPGLQTQVYGNGQLEHPNCPLAIILLRDESLSVSAVSGKCFVAGDHTFGHVIDPRSGEPASRASLAAVVLPSATETDALSTALLVVGEEGHDAIAALRPGLRTLLAGRANNDSLRGARKIELPPRENVS